MTTEAIIILSTIFISYIAMQIYSGILSKRNHRLKMQLERNKQVYAFRMRLIHEMPNVWNAMPDYETMLRSDKPLIASEWVNVDKLVNLN